MSSMMVERNFKKSSSLIESCKRFQMKTLILDERFLIVDFMALKAKVNKERLTEWSVWCLKKYLNGFKCFLLIIERH
jgi:hypothetical protein